jgi:hypothetical protein
MTIHGQILSGLLVEEVTRELLEEVSLLETLPVILIAVDVSVVVVELLSSLLFFSTGNDRETKKEY